MANTWSGEELLPAEATEISSKGKEQGEHIQTLTHTHVRVRLS